MNITLKDAYKIIGGKVLFEALTFELNEGEKAGLVGRNGSGKSTLFRLITKEEGLDGGDLFIKKGLSIGYLKQIPENYDGTGRDYLRAAFEDLNQMLLTMKQLESEMQDPEKMEKALVQYGELQERFTERGGYEVEASINQVANGLQVASLLDQPFSHLSGGEITKLSLAKILLEDPDVLLLDEPTNHLDLHAIEWLEQYLQRYEGAVCIISHDRAFLDHVVTSIVDLEDGDTHFYKGNYSSFEKQKEEKLLIEFHQYQEQQKKIKKMKEAIRRLRQWANEANPPNPKLFKKAKSMERALERMEKLNRPVIDAKKMALSLKAEGRSGKDVIVLEKISKAYKERQVLKDINLHLRYQERLAIVGTNGSGKSTLLKIILNKEEADEGKVTLGESVKVGYLPQNPLQGVDEQQRMIDHFRDHIIVTEGQARHMLAAFMFYGYDVFQKISQLSGGERMRLKLAIFMHQGVNLLVLDEPTNHLDIESQEVLEEALQRFEGTVIGVSHDRHFLNACFLETAYLVDGQLHRFIGNYEDTRSHWRSLLELEASHSKENVKTPKEKTSSSLSYEKQIERLEAQVFKTNDPAGKAELQEQIDDLYTKWMDE
ncbi:ABC transporter ATP-binding protein [Halobacillus andaensis]|uniref:ABC transporter ATP-binding protein n=1 Tax=Halobacillus andaensis TaxID=1176239 RepID=A0A917EYU9_HALAA|nr:ABC-F family ATP-binding cassette domain-containing protein [Halobacillus andaensis]MBP2006209.1 ATPase subunit of ABC transporter with duplicated ATPase domains [Halobacillus andaensis]GGF33298.1 ABC transporter ATP-binding protein [Halobacillus andaensis]